MFAPFAQIPAPPSGAIETWLLSFAAIASIAVLAKKLFVRKARNGPEFVTRTEFHHEITDVREKIDRGFLATRDAIDQAKNHLTVSTERQTASIHKRLNDLETLVARVDERTKSSTPSAKPKKSQMHTISY
jgi:hypothetical protein